MRSFEILKNFRKLFKLIFDYKKRQSNFETQAAGSNLVSYKISFSNRLNLHCLEKSPFEVIYFIYDTSLVSYNI